MFFMKNIKIIPIILIVLTLSTCAFFRKEMLLAEQKEEKFTVDLNSRQEPAGEFDAQFVNGLNPFSGLKISNVTVSYFPVEDAVCLKFKYSLDNYYQFWSREAREVFIEALDKYNEDFLAQNLVRKKAYDTKIKYGTADGYLTWQQYKISLMAKANMQFLFGYTFKEKAPFFTITQGEALYQDPSKDKKRNKRLGEIPMYLTRAQAAELAALFDQKFLRSLVPDLPETPTTRSTTAEFDDY